MKKFHGLERWFSREGWKLLLVLKGAQACTVKKIYRIPVFLFTKPFRNGKTPMLTRDFLVPSREGIFCLLRRKKYSSLCRGNFFPLC
jgi:hypothetical protein